MKITWLENVCTYTDTVSFALWTTWRGPANKQATSFGWLRWPASVPILLFRLVLNLLNLTRSMFYVQAGLQGAVFDWQYWQNKNDLVADYTSGNIYFYYKTIFFYYQTPNRNRLRFQKRWKKITQRKMLKKLAAANILTEFCQICNTS